MDVKGPMQVESLRERRYVFVLVDDFLRYTWVEFFREKLDTFTSFKSLCQCFKRENSEENLRTEVSHNFAYHKVFLMSFHPLYHPNKKGLSSIIIILLKRLLEIYFMPRIFLSLFVRGNKHYLSHP